MSEPPSDSARSAPEPAGAPGGGLFDAVLARGPVRSTVDDEAWLRALLEVEAALAVALAGAGVIPPGAGPAIAEVCGSIRLSVSALGAAAAASGNPVVPLVRELRAALPADLAGSVHLGATSQDILDSAAMLLAHRALGQLLADLAAAADLAAELAAAHRDTPMAGRTLLQQALPTTFGLKAATWMVGLDAAGARLAAVRAGLPAQFGGATGTWAGLGSPAAGPRWPDASRPGSGWPSRCCPGTPSGPRSPSWPALWAGRRRHRQGGRRPHPAGPERGGRAGRGHPRRLVGDGPQTQPGGRDLGLSPAPPRLLASWPPCSPRWRTSTSGPPAPGTPSGDRCANCW
jgi:3-carboxy-cis,cis-muconate cycloisomerase